MGAYLRHKGLRVIYIDQNYQNQNPFFALKKNNPTLVGICTESASLPLVLKIASYAKRRGHTVVLGGIHVSAIKEKILRYPYVDFAIHGEGEIPLHKLALALQNKTSLKQVPGLIYRHKGIIQINKPIQANLNNFPIPDYSFVKHKKIDYFPISTSRGCPYDCTFCPSGSTYKYWNKKNISKVLEEIEFANKKFKIKKFFITDENFGHDISRVKEFCKTLIKSSLKIKWKVMEGVRADSVDSELLDLMKASGCSSIAIGIQTIDSDVFREFKKGENLTTNLEVIALAKEKGFTIGAHFIIGLPNSTFKTDMKSFRFAIKNLDYARFFMYIPYYGTPLYQHVKNRHELLREPIGKNLIGAIWQKPFIKTKKYSSTSIFIMHFIARSYFLTTVVKDMFRKAINFIYP